MPKGQTPRQRTIRKVATGLRKQGLLGKKANTGKLMKMMKKQKKTSSRGRTRFMKSVGLP